MFWNSASEMASPRSKPSPPIKTLKALLTICHRIDHKLDLLLARKPEPVITYMYL